MCLNKPAIVTTSWDDGHVLDLRVAELLARYGVTGTFYIPIEYPIIPRMDCRQIIELRRMGMEIGSHTQTHPRIHRLDDLKVLRELRESKAYLEDLLGEEISAFCYPEGKFTPQQLPLLDQAGYKLARTTVGFRTNLDFEPYLMPVGFQFWPHSRQTLLRHALMQGNIRGATDWMRLWQGQCDLERLGEAMLQHIRNTGGVLHIWGHSWELEEGGLWTELEDFLKRLCDCECLHRLTNSQVLDAMKHTSVYV